MNKKILSSFLVVSIIFNLFFYFFQGRLYVSKDVYWGFNTIEANGFLEPINYKPPEDWNTLFYIHFVDNSSFDEKPKFYAREIVVADSLVTNTNLKEYDIIEKTDDYLIAKDDVYTFKITKNEVFVTDKDGQKGKLKSHYINLK